MKYLQFTARTKFPKSVESCRIFGHIIFALHLPEISASDYIA